MSFSVRAAEAFAAAIADGRENAELPGLMDVSVQITPHITVDESTRDAHSRWCLTNGLRDAIEGVNAFLEEARIICATYKLAKQSLVPAEDYFGIEAFRSRFNEYGLPPKLRHLRDQYSLWPDESAFSDVISVNDARNCLVHRRGVVTAKDVNSAEGRRVSWRAICLRVGTGAKERSAGAGTIVEAGEIVISRIETHAKTFPLGETIRFTAQEFAEICLTLRIFVDETLRAIQVLSKQEPPFAS